MKKDGFDSAWDANREAAQVARTSLSERGLPRDTRGASLRGLPHIGAVEQMFGAE